MHKPKYTFDNDRNQIIGQMMHWSDEYQEYVIECSKKNTGTVFAYEYWIENWFPVDDSVFFSELDRIESVTMFLVNTFGAMP